MAAQLVAQSASFVAVHPAEESGELGGGGAGCEAVRPVFGESVVFGGRLEAAAAYC